LISASCGGSSLAIDGVPIYKAVVGQAAQSLCELVAEAARPLLGKNAGEVDGQVLADEFWALLHGMSALYMDRVAPFDLARVINAVMTLIRGACMKPGMRPRCRSVN
jgi:hypothetical protein